MLTEEIAVEIGKVIDFGFYLKMYPFRWDKSVNGLSSKSSKYTSIFFLITVIVTSIRALLVGYNFIERLLLLNIEDKTDVSLHVIYGSGSWVFAVFCWHTYIFRHKFAQWFNNFLQFNFDQFQSLGDDSRVKKKSWATKACGKIAWLIPTQIVYMIILDAIFLSDYSSVRYPYVSWGVDIDENILLQTIAFFIEDLSSRMILSSAVLYWVIFFTLYSLSTNYWLRIYGSAIQQPKEHPEKLLKTYKEMQLLNVMYNDCFAPILCPVFLVSIIGFHVICFYISLKLYHELNLLVFSFFSSWAVNFIVLELVLFTVQGELERGSEDVFRRLRNTLLGVRGGERRVRALRPLGVHVGSVFVIKRFGALAVVFIVSNITWNCLLLA